MRVPRAGLQPDRLVPGAGELHPDRAPRHSAPPAGLGPQPDGRRVPSRGPLGARAGPHAADLP